jgi:hypothetical protein
MFKPIAFLDSKSPWLLMDKLSAEEIAQAPDTLLSA